MPRHIRRSILAWLWITACHGTPIDPAVAGAAPASTTAPPSGTYAVTIEVVADSCGAIATAPQTSAALIAVQRERGQTRVNLPLAWSPAGTGATMRSDLRLEPGHTTHHRRTSVPGCDAAIVEATTAVIEVTAHGFVVETTLDHPDATACGGDAAGACTTRLRHRYALQQATCPAACTRGARVLPGAQAPRLEIDCGCDEGDARGVP